MNDKIKVVLLILIFIILLFLCNNILNQQGNLNNNTLDYANNIENIQINETENINNSLEENNMNENVLEVTSENFEEEVLKSEKTVLIDFYADWCGPCKMLSPIVEAVASEEKNVKFVKMNVDNCNDIAIEFQVMSIPTLVVIKDGKEVNRSVGLIDKTRIQDLIK